MGFLRRSTEFGLGWADPRATRGVIPIRQVRRLCTYFSRFVVMRKKLTQQPWAK